MRALNRLNRKMGSESGQSLVLAVIVMFLLVFLGVMFIIIISRNLTRAARSTDVTEATALAEAGIRYADRLLTMGEDGADWRPAPDNLQIADKEHPDYQWLRPYSPTEAADSSTGPTGGFTSFGSGDGRFLLRVTYDPNPDDPISKFIKIESIGRVGFVDKNDPTTWGDAAKIKLRRELTAYKPIGLTDYSRFVTNKEKRDAAIPIGCPGYALQLGRPDNGNEPARGAPIRVNGNLTWYGSQVDLYLRGRDMGAGRWDPLDTVEVAGNISHENVSTSSGNSFINVVVHRILGTNVPSQNVAPSLPPTNFDSVGGFYRDGNADFPDLNGYARNIKRLEPPLIDEQDPATKLTRYRLLTMNSGTWKDDSNNNRFNTGRYGWGKGVYIENRRDQQPESETIFGGLSLRADWTKPNNDMTAYWKGPYYVPPGCIIVLNPEDTDGDTYPDMTITRTDIIPGRGNQRKTVWRDYNGDPRPEWGQTVTMPYPTPDRKIPDPADPTNRSSDISVPGNGVVFAEGNVRIRGMLPKGVQLTVVSNGTIYIEGNVLKNRETDNNGSITVDPTSAIALLAKNYICVNTTQFVSLLTEIGPMSVGSDSMNGEPPYHLIVTPEPSSNFRSLFTFGPPDDVQATVDPFISIRHAGQYGPAYINMWINPQLNPPPAGLYMWNVGGTPLPFFGVGDAAFGGIYGGQTSLFRQDIWPLVGGPTVNTSVGYPNYLELGIDQSPPFEMLGTKILPEIRNYLVSSFAIQPMDVRIEAILYAQEKSFFVIPGVWFNPDPEDQPGGTRPPGTDPKFPYFGQGLDVKITIDGAVTENLPASVADSGEWMIKWGKIPDTYGSSGESTAHPGQGLTFVYDSTLGWPIYNNAYIRTDRFGRALPITPKLPVCTSLIYFGDAP